MNTERLINFVDNKMKLEIVSLESQLELVINDPNIDIETKYTSIDNYLGRINSLHEKIKSWEHYTNNNNNNNNN